MEELDIEQDLSDILTADSEVVTDEVMYDPSAPHWTVDRDKLIKVLHLVTSFPAKSTVFLCLRKEGNFLRIHANNKDALLDASLEILNSSPYETDKVYFLDPKLLLTFAQNFSSFCLSFDENGNILFESPYSVYQLEVFSLSLQDIVIPIEDNLEWIPYPLTRQQTCVFKALFGFAPSLTDNKVLVCPDKITANFTLYQHSVATETGAKENFYIRRIDVSTLAEFTSYETEYAITQSRLYFKNELGIVSFLRLPFIEKEYSAPDTYAVGDLVGEFSVDVKMLRRALKLTAVLSSPTVDIRQDGENVLLLAGTRAKFQIGQGSLKEDFSLSTELFTKLVATIDVGEIFVKCKVAEKGIELRIEKDKEVVYSLSRTTVGAMKRKDKIEKKLANREVRKEQLKEKGKFSENQAEKVDTVDELIGDL